MIKIKQAVIPAAGLGSRFLPTTKCLPKELIPLVDRPCLDHVVDEAIAAGVEEFILVLSPEKKGILDYYSPNSHLNKWLKDRQRDDILASLKHIETKARFEVVCQDEPLGLGHAVWCAKEKIKNDWFFVILPDDVIDAKEPVCLQILKAFQEEKTPMISVMSVPWDQVHHYGIVKGQALSDHRGRLEQIVEKPCREEAPSNLAVIGRYILPQSIFQTLEDLTPGSGGEIQLTDALETLISTTGLHSYSFQGTRYDTGNPLGWLKASIGMALQNDQFREPLKEFLKLVSAGI